MKTNATENKRNYIFAFLTAMSIFAMGQLLYIGTDLVVPIYMIIQTFTKNFLPFNSIVWYNPNVEFYTINHS